MFFHCFDNLFGSVAFEVSAVCRKAIRARPKSYHVQVTRHDAERIDVQSFVIDAIVQVAHKSPQRECCG